MIFSTVWLLGKLRNSFLFCNLTTKIMIKVCLRSLLSTLTIHRLCWPISSSSKRDDGSYPPRPLGTCERFHALIELNEKFKNLRPSFSIIFYLFSVQPNVLLILLFIFCPRVICCYLLHYSSSLGFCCCYLLLLLLLLLLLFLNGILPAIGWVYCFRLGFFWR